MMLAYVLNTYPQPSQSFIRRELRALEEQGHSVLRLAMRRPTVPLVDPLDDAEQSRTDYVLEKGAAALFGAVARMALSAPRAAARALGLAIRLGRKSETGVLRHLIYFAEGCHVARACADAGITHIHAHFGTNAATVAMLVKVLGGPDYSFTVHGPEEFDAPRALCLGEKIARSAFTVAISSYGRAQLCRWVAPGYWDRIKVVHCGIDPAAFPAPAPVPDGPLRLISIGRFAEQKGQMILVAAMAEIVRHHPDAKLILVGDGELRGLIEAEIARLGLARNIALTGWLSEADVTARLAGSHALVMPSFAEGLPMVIMEAMAAGRPVITTHVAGIPELVKPGENGWLVPAGDAPALAEAVLDMAACSRDKLSNMGARGRQRALARHDVGQEARKLSGHFGI
ncbi:glycosyltransferase [Roseovarius sp. SYSU LYC5161]|uniref:glycosyltransferase n=1 Tax=Roseovarius halophilus (ex Wu et al. 2025) TaxID=3376060 RepID=UPI00399BD2F3